MICIFAALSACLSCGLQVPDDRSALVLTIEGDGECAQSRFLLARFFSGGVEADRWGFLAGEGLPYTYELWTRLEGNVEVRAEGYLCPGGDCRGVEERPDLLAGQGSGVILLAHGRRAPLTVVISPRRCGNGVVEPGEECDAGEEDPAAPCGPACTYPFRSVYGDAGLEDDSFTAFPLGDGFAVAWTEGAGGAAVGIGGVDLLLFDTSGLSRSESPRSFGVSCGGGSSFRPALEGISSWGDGGPFALVVYPEYLTETSCSLCFALLDEGGGTAGQGMLLGSSGVGTGSGFPVLMIDGARAAVASRQDSSVMLHLVGVPGGEERGRALVQALEPGEQCSGISLVSLDGDFVAAAWRRKTADGPILSMLGRWNVIAPGELVPFDAAPVELDAESSAIIRGTGLAAAGAGPGRLVLVTTAGPAIEAFWLDKGSTRENFEGVAFDAGLEPDAAIAGTEVLEAGAVHVLVAHPSPDPGRCSFTLLRIPGPGSGDDPQTVQTWGVPNPLGCEAKLLRLPVERIAVVFRTLVEGDPGAVRGDLMVDIVSSSK